MTATIDRIGSKAVIEEFLALKRVAMVGVSHTETDFSRTLWKELKARGYDVVPVNPNATEIDGEKCFGSLRQIPKPVDWVLLMTSPAVSESVVRECLVVGVSRVWFHKGGGVGSVSQAALDFCQANGMEVVPGQCPFMFLPDSAFFHRFHGFGKKLVGKYPK